MSQFFKATTRPELLEKFHLSGDLVKRRLQLLGAKLFTKCALGEAISDKDLEYRAMRLNRQFNIGFTAKDLVAGCELSRRPTEVSDEIYKATNDMLDGLIGLTDEELENLDLMSEIRSLPTDLLEYNIKPLYAEQFKIVDGVVKNKNGEALMEFKGEISPELQTQIVRELKRILPMNLYDFYENWNQEWINEMGVENSMARSLRTGTLAQIRNHDMKVSYPEHTVEYYLKKMVPWIFSPTTLNMFYNDMLNQVYSFMRAVVEGNEPRTIGTLPQLTRQTAIRP